MSKKQKKKKRSAKKEDEEEQSVEEDQSSGIKTGGDEEKAIANNNEDNNSKKRKRRRPVEVQVVTCPSAFPISSSNSSRTNKSSRSKQSPDPASALSSQQQQQQQQFLDFYDTAKEVRALGATAFVGKQKRNYDDEQYKFLTGRSKKKPQVPLPIVRGLKKAAAKREARQFQEAKEAGIVLPSSSNTNSKKRNNNKADNNDRTSQIHGPAPSIGFVNKGILKLKGKPR